jgi:hypothetical protein
MAEALAEASERLGEAPSDERQEPDERREPDGSREPESLGSSEAPEGDTPTEEGVEPQSGTPPPDSESGPAIGSETAEADPDAESPETSINDSEQVGDRSADDALRDAAEAVRELEQDDASREGQERAERISENIRENLQRSSGEGDDEHEASEENWEDFLDRADGAPDRMGTESESGEEVDPNAREEGGTDLAEASPEGRELSGEDGAPQGFTDADGGDPLGAEGTDLESERDVVALRVGQSGDEAPETREIIETAATEGFASRGYQEVYVEYARALEQALAAQEIPAGFERFIRRYFETVEPR